MAAPMNAWKSKLGILSNLLVKRNNLGNSNRLLLCQNTVKSINCQYLARHHSVLVNRASLCRSSLHNVTVNNNLQRMQVRCLGQGDEENKKKDEFRPLKLMEFDEIIWPNMKTIVGWITHKFLMPFVMRKAVDSSLTSESFMKGVVQAVVCVSDLISKGNIAALDGLVTKEVAAEVKTNYDLLSATQRKFIAVNPDDIFLKFIHSIYYGPRRDDNRQPASESDEAERVAEITVVLQGIHGLHQRQQQPPPETYDDAMQEANQDFYVCNYRLQKVCSEEGGGGDGWVITKLNHFRPQDKVEATKFYER